MPYRVQPPPKSAKKICWLECPYCYGASANDNAGDRMHRDVAVKTLHDIADGGVKKVIFAGYATDPGIVTSAGLAGISGVISYLWSKPFPNQSLHVKHSLALLQV
jgi:hypothetical protein